MSSLLQSFPICHFPVSSSIADEINTISNIKRMHSRYVALNALFFMPYLFYCDISIKEYRNMLCLSWYDCSTTIGIVTHEIYDVNKQSVKNFFLYQKYSDTCIYGLDVNNV